MKQILRPVMVLAMLSALAACGGGGAGSAGSGGGNETIPGNGGGDNSGSNGGAGTDNGSESESGSGSGNGSGGGTEHGSGSGSGSGAVVDTGAQRISAALASGNPAGLQAADAGSLLEQAIAEASRKNAAHAAALRSIYGSGDARLSLALNVGTSTSAIIGVLASTTATPYIVADNGAGIAALSNNGAGRGMAYGADVLQWMAGTSKEQQHYPQFLRAFTWLMTGSGTGSLPATIKYASAGYTASYVKNFITRTGRTPVAVDCAVANISNTCWVDADVIVFGGSVAASAGLTAQVQKYLAAGKAVIYMHPNWTQSAGGICLELGDHIPIRSLPYFKARRLLSTLLIPVTSPPAP